MLKLTRKSEYALIALQHIAALPRGERVNVSTLADARGIPRHLLAKVMQELKQAGIVGSTKGVAGGYALARDLREVRFLEVIGPFEDTVGLANCCDADQAGCDRTSSCSLHGPIASLNAYVMRGLRPLTMARFLAGGSEADSSLADG